jgi:hypothetical protein
MISGAEALIAPGRINPIYLEGKLLPLQASTAAELGLKDGQVVQASIKLQNEQPMLILQGRTLPAPASKHHKRVSLFGSEFKTAHWSLSARSPLFPELPHCFIGQMSAQSCRSCFKKEL